MPPDLSSSLAVCTWNVFHGRDAPPNPALYTWRSRLFKVTEYDGRHIQVNRPLDARFCGMIAGMPWSVCLLQECPPRWEALLARVAGASDGAIPEGSRAAAATGARRVTTARALTSRNRFLALRELLARWNIDLMASGGGSANLILVREPWRIVLGSERRLVLNPLPGRGRRERRMMLWVEIERADAVAGGAGDGGRICVANLHATAHAPRVAEPEVLRAAAYATRWAGERPLIMGGDFNLRPNNSDVFAQLSARFSLGSPTGAGVIDHLLVRGLRAVELPARMPTAAREFEDRFDAAADAARRGLSELFGGALRTDPEVAGDRLIRMSDHAPVLAVFAS